MVLVQFRNKDPDSFNTGKRAVMKIKCIEKVQSLLCLSSKIHIICKYRNILLTHVRRIRIVKIKIYSLYLKGSSNDKLKNQGQISACLWNRELDTQKTALYKGVYITFWSFQQHTTCYVLEMSSNLYVLDTRNIWRDLFQKKHNFIRCSILG